MDRVTHQQVEAIFGRLRAELEMLAANGSAVAQGVLDRLCTNADNCRESGRWCDPQARLTTVTADANRKAHG